MSFPLFDLVKDLAVARGGRPGEVDSDDPATMRRRIAALLWIPGLALALFAGGWTDSWLVGVGIVVLTLALMVLVAVGPRRLGARLRSLRRTGGN